MCSCLDYVPQPGVLYADLQELRPAIFALRAFNVETGLISEHAKSEMLVLMRCQVGST
jgi:hypothetical protein